MGLKTWHRFKSWLRRVVEGDLPERPKWDAPPRIPPLSPHSEVIHYVTTPTLESIEVRHGPGGKITRLVINGKDADPDSPEGREAIGRVTEASLAAEQACKNIDVSLGQMSKDLDQTFSRLHKDLDAVFSRKPAHPPGKE